MFKIMRVSGSFLMLDYNNMEVLLENIRKLEKTGAQFIHYDVMDGKFVPKKTFDHNLVKELQKHTNLMADVHLMVENPDKVVMDYIDAGADILTVHYEALPLDRLEKTLKLIKSKTVLAGVAINPETPVYKLKNLIKNDLVDVVCVMGVKPGAGGQAFIPGTAEKVAELRYMSKSVYLEVDGGVNAMTARILRKVGVDILVSGSYLFGSKNMKKTVKNLKGKDYGSRIRDYFARNKKEG